MRTDTIAAIATAMSSSGIGIIRISGDEAVGIVDRIFSMKNGKKLSDMPTHTIHYGHIKDGDEENQNAIMALETGECLMQDIYGRVGKVHTQILLQHVFDAFDTRPPRREEAS